MIEQNELDGGITYADNKPMRMVLDENGVYKRTEEMKAPAAAKPAAPAAAKSLDFQAPT